MFDRNGVDGTGLISHTQTICFYLYTYSGERKYCMHRTTLIHVHTYIYVTSQGERVLRDMGFHYSKTNI